MRQRPFPYAKMAVIAAALFLSALVLDRIVTRRSPQTARSPQTLAAAELDSLSGYLRPIPDSLLRVLADTSPVRTRDSFRPSLTPVVRPTGRHSAPRAAKWTLSAILISDRHRVAVINEEVVGIGQALSDGSRVAAIERDFVDIVTADGTHHVVGLPSRGS